MNLRVYNALRKIASKYEDHQEWLANIRPKLESDEQAFKKLLGKLSPISSFTVNGYGDIINIQKHKDSKVSDSDFKQATSKLKNYWNEYGYKNKYQKIENSNPASSDKRHSEYSFDIR